MVHFEESVINSNYGSSIDFSDYFLAVGASREGVVAVVDDDELEDYLGNV